MREQDRSLRIIGGNWRGRKASFPNNPAIRPTPDRVRETLFNWLMQEVAGSRCVDLFSGSGALGLEALSRRAAHVTFVDNSQESCAAIESNLRRFEAPQSRYSILCTDALTFMVNNETSFDLAFLDPPFKSDNWLNPLATLANHVEGAIYMETPEAISGTYVPGGWHLFRQKKAGNVHYCLCRPDISQ